MLQPLLLTCLLLLHGVFSISPVHAVTGISALAGVPVITPVAGDPAVDFVSALSVINQTTGL